MGMLNHEKETMIENQFKTEDVALLYNAFVSLCDHIEYSNPSCTVCPIGQSTCFHKENGEKFWDALKRIDAEINKHNM